VSKKRKVKKSSSRSASAANRIAKTHKETFVKRAPLSSPKSTEKKEGLGVVKIVLFVIALLIIGATVLAKYTGANKSRGTSIQDDACTATEECVEGHVCYQYATNPFSCKKRCKDDDECGNGHQCKPVVRFGKKRVKPMKVCVAKSEL
jgi:hypothetical protein